MARFRGDDDDDFIFGTRGADTIDGLGGFDKLKGGAGDDLLVGGAGDDQLYGGAGDDTLRPGRNTDVEGDKIYGGVGSDLIDFRGSGPDGGSTFSFYELWYTALRGGVTVRISGATGTVAKSSRDGGGTDRLTGMNWTAESDRPNSATLGVVGTQRDDRFELNPGDGRFVSVAPMAGDDVINAASGTVRLRYLSGEGSGIDVRVTGSTNGRMRGEVDDQFGAFDRFTGVSQLDGSRFDDVFTGSRGDDYFITNEGDDDVNAGAGFDLVRYDRTGCVRLELDLAARTAVNVWDRGDPRRDGTFLDSLTGVEHVQGSRGDDTMRGATGAQRLEGRDGDDLIDGRSGADTLYGDAGDDTLIGGRGNDVLGGRDGRDRFEFRRGDGSDRIEGFEDGIDTIRIRSGASNFGALEIEQSGGDALVRFANVRLTLLGFDADLLDGRDFVFG
jgi:Ca2+-binding RTX toxin-like protein